MERNLKQVWDQLRGQRPQRKDYLEEVRLEGFRGIADLRVPFPYPVSVLAGPNGCGKSTVLFAVACAYAQLDQAVTTFTPSSLFPGLQPKQPELPRDDRSGTKLTYAYLSGGDRLSMQWSRGSGKWNRSFFGKKEARQPKRPVYLRTLANLSNPSEVRSVLQLARAELTRADIDASLIAFAQRILHYRYARLSVISGRGRSVLFAERAIDVENPEGGAAYSEFHMSAGERAVLRLSIELSKIHDSLVLVDEIEAGLHPYVQQQLMLELQRLALRNRLQMVVTTHSPVVLDTVPQEARAFLDRRGANVVLVPAYRDIIQKSLYGKSQNALSFLCEDDMGEAAMRGVMEALGPSLDLLASDVVVGRDTGKDEFVGHLRAFAKFQRLRDVVFVLDGDGRAIADRLRSEAADRGQTAQVLVLPGDGGPETWAWSRLAASPEEYAAELGVSHDILRGRMRDLDDLYAAAADKPAEIAKNKLDSLAQDDLSREASEIVRLIARLDVRSGIGEIAALAAQVQDVIGTWRGQQ